MKKLKINPIIGYPVLNNVWTRLLKTLPRQYWDTNLFIGIHNTPDYELTKGAWAQKGHIVLGSGYLKRYKHSPEALAEILAHELAHHVLGHMHSYCDSAHQEQDADHLGLCIAMKAGFSGRLILESLKSFEAWRKKGIQKSHVKSHGSAQHRIDQLAKQLKYLGEL